MNLEDPFISDLDQKVIAATGYGKRRGFGKKPVILVIDAQKKFVGTDAPILESMEKYPLSIGKKAWEAVGNISRILKKGRRQKLPVIFSTSAAAGNEIRFNSFARKRHPHEASPASPKDGDDIPEAIRPGDTEWVVHKRYASVFFGTPLMTFLNTLRCDTLLVTGFVTSGCVRATVVDGASYNLNVTVVKDCVADRFDFAHRLSLIDMDLKYADVISLDEALTCMDRLS
jgi:nicotinamidase-related amidase